VKKSGGDATALTAREEAMVAYQQHVSDQTLLWVDSLARYCDLSAPHHEPDIDYHLAPINEPMDRVYYEALACNEVAFTPKHYKAARKCEDSGLWRIAEEKEWNGMTSMGTFADAPICGQRLHHLLWTYKVKSDGRRKARLCFDGRRQDPSTYDIVRSPCTRFTHHLYRC
jgi:hypothetical protein